MSGRIVIVKRAPTFEAMQFDGTALSAREIVAWANAGKISMPGQRAMTTDHEGRTGLMIWVQRPSWMDGTRWQPVFEGWWVVRGYDGWVDQAMGFEPVLLTCSPDDFDNSFDYGGMLIALPQDDG